MFKRFIIVIIGIITLIPGPYYLGIEVHDKENVTSYNVGDYWLDGFAYTMGACVLLAIAYGILTIILNYIIKGDLSFSNPFNFKK